MVVNWTNKAKEDLKKWVKSSLWESKHIDIYVKKLISFGYDLADFPEMGKELFYIKKNNKTYLIRQLIFQYHRILYYIDNKINIIGVLHTNQDLEKFKKYFKT